MTALRNRKKAGAVPVNAPELRRSPPRLMNFRELIVFLDVSERHARNLIASRRIPTIRLGDRVLFNTERVIDAIERASV